MMAVLQQVHQDSTDSSLQPSLFAGLFPILSLFLQKSLSLQPVVPAQLILAMYLLLCQHTLSASSSLAMDYCQPSCLLLRVCPNR